MLRFELRDFSFAPSVDAVALVTPQFDSDARVMFAETVGDGE